MAETLTIRTASSTEVVKIAVPGPQGPKGEKGDPGDVAGLPLSTQGDTLYRGASQNERLAIGTTGQVLKVSAQGLPSWANESGAVTSVNGATGAVTVAAATHATRHEAGNEDELQATAALVATDVVALNGVYFWDGTTTGGRPNFYKTGTRKNTKIVYNATTLQWNLVRNTVIEAIGSDGPNTVPWDQETWEDTRNPAQVTNITVTRLPLETMVQKLAETGGAATATTSEDGLMSSSDKTKLNGIASGAEVNVQSNWTESNLASDAFILNKPATFAPSAHSSSHAAGGSDPLTPAAIGAMYALETRTNDFYSTSTYVLAQGRNVQLNARVSATNAIGTITLPRLSVDGSQNGDELVIVGFVEANNGTLIVEKYQWVGSSYINSKITELTTTKNGSWRFRLLDGVWELQPVGTHTHGNLTNDGKIGSTSGLPVVTTTAGAVTTLALGTANQVLRVNSGASGVEFADPAASGVTSVSGTAPIVSSGGTTPTISVTTGSTAGTVAAGDDSRIVGAAQKSANLSDLASASTARTNLGLGGAATLSVGTTAGTVAAGDDSRFHTRSHAMTGTSDHTASNWSVFYSNGSGQVTELALGAANTVLTSNGASSAPSFAAAAASGATNLWIPASAWIPRTTTGCGVDSREQATNRVNTDELLFDAATEEYAQAMVVMPSNYNNGTITCRFYWTASSGSGAVVWALRGRAYADDDALDQAQGTGQTVTDTLLAANDMHVSAATSAITLAGTPAANRPVQFEIYRVAANASDTLAVDARLLGCEIIFN